MLLTSWCVMMESSLVHRGWVRTRRRTARDRRALDSVTTSTWRIHSVDIVRRYG